jgi:hypothetical protein
LITFASGLSGPINLVRSLVIEKGLTIRGPSSRIVIRRANTSPEFRIMRTDSDQPVRLTNLEIRNGRTSGLGGGIINFGALVLTNVVVAGNRAGGHGGGIDNHGPLTLTRSTVSNNSAPSGQGGGIDDHNGVVTLTSSFISDNSGGGIFSSGGRLAFTNSGINQNTAGRGISLDWARVTLERVRIAGNTGGGISQHQSTTTISNSTIVSNSATEGGGILNSAGGRYTVMSSTIVNNSATGRGGGIRNTSGDPFGRLSATLMLINSTVTGNSAAIGGGIENSEDRGGADVVVTNSTIVRNRASQEGGGVHNTIPDPSSDAGSSISLRNTIVAQNTAPIAPDAHEASARFSLIGNGSGSGLSNTNGNQVGSSSSPIDPRIGPLANNGGPTRTHALLAGSPAVNAASSADCPAEDQRGVARPQGSGCDIGSYERE